MSVWRDLQKDVYGEAFDEQVGPRSRRGFRAPRPPAGPETTSDERRTVGPVVRFVVGVFAVIFLALFNASAYLGMYTCPGVFYESGCDYQGAGAAAGFVLVSSLVTGGVFAGLAHMLGGRSRWSIVWSFVAAALLALFILFAGSPWD